MTADLRGRTCVVTGATQGIGKETATALAAMGADVILVARDETKARAVMDEIGARVPGAELDFARCDFASLASIRACAEQLRGKRTQIHVLLNNAGGLNTTRKTSEDGHELTFAVNHLGYFLLTRLLLDRLKAAGDASRTARIVSVASGIHPRGKLDFDDVMSERSYDAFPVYAKSKLCNVLWTYELARRLEGEPVTANCLHPGVIASGFGSNNGPLMRLGMAIARPFMWSAQRGAGTSIKLASSPDVEGVTGKYFDHHGREARSRRARHDERAQKQLWELSERLCGP